MRKYIDIVSEDCDEAEKIIKSTWTEWQDRDGIYVVRRGSNSIYAGFCEQTEAEIFAKKLGDQWTVVRRGRYKDMTDEEAKRDPEIRRKRSMYGFYNEPLAEAEILSPENEEYDEPVDADSERATRVEKHVKDVCTKQFGWEMSGYAVYYDTDMEEISITVEDEVTFDQLQTLKVLGDSIKVTGTANYRIIITIRAHTGLDVPQ